MVKWWYFKAQYKKAEFSLPWPVHVLLGQVKLTRCFGLGSYTEYRIISGLSYFNDVFVPILSHCCLLHEL